MKHLEDCPCSLCVAPPEKPEALLKCDRCPFEAPGAYPWARLRGGLGHQMCRTCWGLPEDDVGWRVGRKVGRTLYRDGELVGMMDTPELARLVVDALAKAKP